MTENIVILENYLYLFNKILLGKYNKLEENFRFTFC